MDVNKKVRYIASSFSVIFKSERFLRGMIENALSQDRFSEIQFVFVNPNSPDSSRKILEPYLENYSNFKYTELNQDPGLYECWNIGVENCDSEFVTNWNPDDRRTSNSISCLRENLNANDDCDLIYGLTLLTSVENEKVENCKSEFIWTAYDHSFQNLFFHNSPHCMPMWRKSLHDRFGRFDNSYVSAGDGEMWLRAALGGSKFLKLNQVVGSYYESENSVSRNKEKIDFLIKEVYEMRCKMLKKTMGIHE